MNPILCLMLGFFLTFSTWFEPQKLSAQCCPEYCPDCVDDTIWFYPYDPCEYYLTVPWSSTTSRNITIVLIAVGLGCIAGMIAGNCASKKNNKHHHHGHHRSVKNQGFGINF